MKKIINISGMHCVSCEMLLEKELKKIDSVKLLMVSHKKWLMEIEYENESDYKKVINIIEKNWYKVWDIWKWENFVWKILSNIIILLIVLILVIYTKAFDLYKFIPNIDTISYSWAFFVWIIASLSTCLAIVWWLIISFSKYVDSKNGNNWHLKVQLWFQIWRILWFTFLWWILWLTWKVIGISFWFSWIFTFVVWILFFYLGLNILWILPSISSLWIHMPKWLVSKIESIKQPKYAPIVWALTFFLPCGFTQTMQLLAISSGSFVSWAMIMLLFALWTFPVLFSLWMSTSYFKEKNFSIFNKIVAIILIFFSITTITNSYNLLSYYIPQSNNSVITQNEENKDSLNSQAEVINLWHDWYNTDPENIVLEKWKNYKIVITPESDGKWCMSTQLIPKLKTDISYVRKWEQIVYDINNAQAGTYEIVCGSMWMLQWKIIIK